VADYYEILGVDSSATLKEITSAYKRRAQVVHPDHHQKDPDSIRAEAERLFEQIDEAYKVLSNTALRAQYDDKLAQERSSEPESGAPLILEPLQVNVRPDKRGDFKIEAHLELDGPEDQPPPTVECDDSAIEITSVEFVPFFNTKRYPARVVVRAILLGPTTQRAEFIYSVGDHTVTQRVSITTAVRPPHTPPSAGEHRPPPQPRQYRFPPSRHPFQILAGGLALLVLIVGIAASGIHGSLFNNSSRLTSLVSAQLGEPYPLSPCKLAFPITGSDEVGGCYGVQLTVENKDKKAHTIEMVVDAQSLCPAGVRQPDYTSYGATVNVDAGQRVTVNAASAFARTLMNYSGGFRDGCGDHGTVDPIGVKFWIECAEILLNENSFSNRGPPVGNLPLPSCSGIATIPLN
jgi:hypothetical protein